MGDVIGFQSWGFIKPSGTRGIIHVWPTTDTDFEIGHESSSGHSWGHFARFATAEAAVAAAYSLNREVLGGQCEVYLTPGVRRALSSSARAPLPPLDREEF